jgi:hypothetical protein
MISTTIWCELFFLDTQGPSPYTFPLKKQVLIYYYLQKKYPEGHFMEVGMAIGMIIFSGVGVALSTSTDNPGMIGVGPAIGLAIGIGIGKSMEEKYRKKGLIRPLTQKEKEARKKSVVIGLVVAALGVIALVSFIVLDR